MKEILLKFMTKKGEEAYWKVEKEGSQQSRLDRKIAKSVAKDSVISKNPLVVKIKVKIRRLAVRVQLEEQTVLALKKKGAEKDVDYTMDVIW